MLSSDFPSLDNLMLYKRDQNRRFQKEIGMQQKGR